MTIRLLRLKQQVSSLNATLKKYSILWEFMFDAVVWLAISFHQFPCRSMNAFLIYHKSFCLSVWCWKRLVSAWLSQTSVVWFIFCCPLAAKTFFFVIYSSFLVGLCKIIDFCLIKSNIRCTFNYFFSTAPAAQSLRLLVCLFSLRSGQLWPWLSRSEL